MEANNIVIFLCFEFVLMSLVLFFANLQDSYSKAFFGWWDYYIDLATERLKFTSRKYLLGLNIVTALVVSMTSFHFISSGQDYLVLFFKVMADVYLVGLFSYILKRVAVSAHQIKSLIEENIEITSPKEFIKIHGEGFIDKNGVPVFFKKNTPDESQQAMISSIQKSFEGNQRKQEEAKKNYSLQGIKTLLEKTQNIHPFVEFCEIALGQVADYVEANFAILHALDDEKKNLKIVASYKTMRGNLLLQNFELGESEIGQAASSEKMSEFKISWEKSKNPLSESQYGIVFPLISGHELIGTAFFAFAEEIGEREKIFLKEACQKISENSLSAKRGEELQKKVAEMEKYAGYKLEEVKALQEKHTQEALNSQILPSLLLTKDGAVLAKNTAFEEEFALTKLEEKTEKGLNFIEEISLNEEVENWQDLVSFTNFKEPSQATLSADEEILLYSICLSKPEFDGFEECFLLSLWKKETCYGCDH